MAESIISPDVFTRENDISFIQSQPLAAGAAFVGPTVKGPLEQPTVITSYSEYVRTFGTTLTSGSNNYEYLTSIAVRNYFSQGGNTALVTRVASGSQNYTAAESTFITPLTGSVAPFTLYTLGKGAMYNNATGSSYTAAYENSDGSLKSGSADNLRWEISGVITGSGTFNLLIRQGDDNSKNKAVLETYSNVSLDPNSDRYIAKVIGDQYTTVSSESGNYYVSTVGEYPNRSKYVRAVVNRPTPNYLATDGITINSGSDGISYSNYLPAANATPAVSSGSFYNAVGSVPGNMKFFGEISGSTAVQGLNAAAYTKAISILSNKDDYQFNIITVPGLTMDNSTVSSVITNVISLAEERGDCIAVVDPVGFGNGTGIIADVTSQTVAKNSSYAAAYWPWVQVQSETGKYVWVPASTLVPGVYAFTDNYKAPWFAPAGMIKGGLPGVVRVERKLSKANRDELYSNKVNPIATLSGQGIVILGQKTLQTKASALDRVNVRRLLIELKKFIGDQAKNLLFEQNTGLTRNKFLSTVNPYLDSVVQREGLYAYRVVMDGNNNTADVIDRNQLVGQILIQPTKTIEFVVLDFTIEPTGVAFS